MIRDFVRRAVATAALVLGLSAPGDQSAAANPLDNQTIRIIIAHKAGNTTDTMARAFAETMKVHLPGASVNLQNLDGSGGTLAMQELSEAKGALITIAFVNSSVIFTQVIHGDRLPYDLDQFRWIGALASSQRVLVVRSDIADRIHFTKPAPDAAPLVSLAMSANAHNYIDGLLLNSMTTLRLRMVPGFKTEQQNAMLLSGDADAGIGTYENFREFIEAGDVVPVLKFGTVGYPDALDALPTLQDVAIPGASPEVLSLTTQLSDMGRFVVASPATTDEQRDALIALFDKVVTDPDYLDRLKAANISGNPKPAAAVTGFIGSLLADADVQIKLRATIACGQQISDAKRKTCD